MPHLFGGVGKRMRHVDAVKLLHPGGGEVLAADLYEVAIDRGFRYSEPGGRRGNAAFEEEEASILEGSDDL